MKVRVYKITSPVTSELDPVTNDYRHSLQSKEVIVLTAAGVQYPDCNGTLAVPAGLE